MRQGKESVWNREIHIPIDKLWNRTPEGVRRWMSLHLADWLCALCVGAIVAAPLPITILALYKKRIDFPYLYFRQMALVIINPFVKYVGLAALFAALWKRRRALNPLGRLKRHPTFDFFFALALWMFLATCVNGWGYWATFGTESMGESASVQIGYFVLLFPVCVLLESQQMKRVLLRSHMAISAFLAVSAFFLWKAQTESLLVKGWKPDFTAIYINRNYYGYYLTVSTALGLAMFCAEESPFWTAFSGVCLAVNAAALSYCKTLGAWVGVWFACAFLVIASRIRDGKFHWRPLTAVGLFLCVFLPAGFLNGYLLRDIFQLAYDIGLILFNPYAEETLHAGSDRWRVWLHCMELIRQHPIFGIGFEGIIANNLEEFVQNGRPHNEYMQYAVFYGVPAAILYFLGCFSVYMRALRLRRRLDNLTLAALTAAFGYLVGAFFGLTIFNAAPYLFVMLGLGYVRAADAP